MAASKSISIEILGVRFDLVGFHQAAGIVCDWLKDGKKRHITTPNPEFVVAAQKDDEFRDILKNADLSITDGRGIQLAARFLGLPIPQRITGTDFMQELCEKFAKLRVPIFLLGGRNGAAEKCAEKLKNKFPDLQIAGIFEGKANEAGDREATSTINATNAKVVFVAYGAPKQEKWIARNLPRLNSIKAAMGVGGAFDYIAGEITRAPIFMRKMGLEWLWRLFKQPGRFNRIFRAVVIFPLLVLKEKIG
ncbi:glycosyltransferase [Patescibacteria group bacterium]|nr:MAG: glycosyltransferase [Patescibacteria group bacterium]